MANWLNFEKIKTWEFPVYVGFQYDHISDEVIARALADVENLARVDPSLDWEDDSFLAEHSGIREEHKHAYRVAALVQAFRSGAVMRKAISLDTFSVRDCCSCVSNGHHRVRALQYLGLTAGPFSLCGVVPALKELVHLAGEDCLREMHRYFCEDLLSKDRDDVCVD